MFVAKLGRDFGHGRVAAPNPHAPTHPMSTVLAVAPQSAPDCRLWTTGPVLNQGSTPMCTAYCGRDHLNAEPLPEPQRGPDPVTLYGEEKAIDGLPSGSDGSTMLALATILSQQQLIDEFVWADDEPTAREWVLTRSPIMFGTNWYYSMYFPDSEGQVFIVNPMDGHGVVGGHAYLCCGFDAASRLYTFQNSWGIDWGLSGYFKMSVAAVAQLFAEGGEGVAARNQLVPPYLTVGGRRV